MTGAEFGGVDIDLLADYIGGALTGTPEESAVAARIADDPEWQAAYASLTEGMALVSAELGRFGPEPMPADLAARLDAALTTPADLDPTARSAFLDLIAADSEPATAIAADLAPPAPQLSLVGGGAAEGDVPNPVRKKALGPPRGRRLRWAAPIAVAAGLIAFVGFGLDYLAGRSTQSSTDSSSAAGTSQKQAEAPSMARSPLGAGQLLATGTDYTRATLGVPPNQPMTAPYGTSSESAPVPTAPTGVAADGGSALQRLTAPIALADCLEAIEQKNANGVISVESVDFARFSGAPAVIVRFTAANGHWAWASGADCGTPPGDAATLDKVPVG